ncbi:hypothetical protein LCGC14_2568350 [marine sediment metagenome]|uniref:Uncharacterized protein n=1 Tax=marine sediment metagenome TaxID=412755 RepID=A0A0F9DAS7_9ZZZZ
MKEQGQVSGRTASGNKFDLVAAKKRCEAASEGEWRLVRSPHSDRTMIGAGGGKVIGAITGIKDAEFIVHARTDLPAFIEALEEAQRCNECADSPEDIRLPAGYRCYFCDKRFCGPHAKLHFKGDNTSTALAEAQGKIAELERLTYDLHQRSGHPDSACLRCQFYAILRGTKEGNDEQEG